MPSQPGKATPPSLSGPDHWWREDLVNVGRAAAEGFGSHVSLEGVRDLSPAHPAREELGRSNILSVDEAQNLHLVMFSFLAEDPKRQTITMYEAIANSHTGEVVASTAYGPGTAAPDIKLQPGTAGLATIGDASSRFMGHMKIRSGDAAAAVTYTEQSAHVDRTATGSWSPLALPDPPRVDPTIDGPDAGGPRLSL